VFNKMGLSAKLTGGFVTLSAAALLLAAVSVVAMRSLNRTLDSAIQVDARRVELAGRIQYSSADLLRLENGIIFRLMSQDAAGSDNYKKRAAEVLAELRKEFAELGPLVGQVGSQMRCARLYRSSSTTWRRGSYPIESLLPEREWPRWREGMR